MLIFLDRLILAAKDQSRPAVSSILFETKTSDWFYEDQIKRHIIGIDCKSSKELAAKLHGRIPLMKVSCRPLSLSSLQFMNNS